MFKSIGMTNNLHPLADGNYAGKPQATTPSQPLGVFESQKAGALAANDEQCKYSLSI